MTDHWVVPISARAEAPFELPLKPGGLEGRFLGVVCNGKEFSEPVLRRLAAALQSRLAPAEVGWWDKGFPAKAAPFLKEVIQRSDFVLNGVGH